MQLWHFVAYVHLCFFAQSLLTAWVYAWKLQVKQDGFPSPREIKNRLWSVFVILKWMQKSCMNDGKRNETVLRPQWPKISIDTYVYNYILACWVFFVCFLRDAGYETNYIFPDIVSEISFPYIMLKLSLHLKMSTVLSFASLPQISSLFHFLCSNSRALRGNQGRDEHSSLLAREEGNTNGHGSVFRESP